MAGAPAFTISPGCTQMGALTFTISPGCARHTLVPRPSQSAQAVHDTDMEAPASAYLSHSPEGWKFRLEVLASRFLMRALCFACPCCVNLGECHTFMSFFLSGMFFKGTNPIMKTSSPRPSLNVITSNGPIPKLHWGWTFVIYKLKRYNVVYRLANGKSRDPPSLGPFTPSSSVVVREELLL